MASTTQFTPEQVAEHNTPQSAWIILHGKVYDVTKYSDDHPGGNGVLMEVAGTDATDDFELQDHSVDARRIMESFLIGSLKGWVAKPLRDPVRLASDAAMARTRARASRPLGISKKFLWVGAWILAGIAAVLISLPSLGPSLDQGTAAVGTTVAEGSGFWSGVAASLIVTAGAGTVALQRLRQAVFTPVKDVFEHPPYYHYPVPEES